MSRHIGQPTFEHLMSTGEQRVRGFKREAAAARRRALFERKDREYAAVGIPETVRVSGHVRTVIRGNAWAGTGLGAFRDRDARALNRFR